MFGEITSDKMILNEYGKIANSCWIEILKHFPNVELDEYVIMPNHVHGIIIITGNKPVEAGLAPALNKINKPALNNINNFNLDNIQNHALNNINKSTLDTINNRATAVYANRATARVAPTIGNVVGAFKSITTNECLKLFKRIDKRIGKILQHNYYEHIIRDKDELNRIREYIIQNPAKWKDDEYNLNN
jgi:putative transposase